MSFSRQYLRGFALAGVFFLVGCSQPGPDTSPPGVNPVIQLGSLLLILLTMASASAVRMSIGQAFP